ncbi:DUF4230 domain-containing protein [Hoylesella timonensis]|jgi:hypothetical protein|uniref:DUF4230 domain-containing protein n=1 Tax=Hoylesella timonensis S9-PR14 TaxID=1401062 RepID=A0A098YS09_9BACT|nr:DUF4230 domain-containing protein [Hoylesella timonensis]KGI22126.1 hypothetical protein HMPREF9304_06315 [Hoylesella timonensis S9-PR14]
MRLQLILFSIFMLCCSCSRHKTEQETATIDTIPMMVMQIQKCSKLYTAEYKVHKIITHDDKMKLNGSFMKKDFSINLPLGSRKIAIPMDATLKAYIDFADFNEDNVKRQGDKIEIILPDPHVTLTSTRINHDEIKQYVALTRSRFSDEELSSYERQGREAIIKDIPSMGMMDMARESAARTLIPMIEQMGFEESNITVSFRKHYTLNDIKSLLDKTTIEHGNNAK